MEIGLREWLIVIGIVVIGGILFDGWRRMRGSKGKLKFKLERKIADAPEAVSENSELLGPSRSVDFPQGAGFEPDEENLPSLSVRGPSRRRLDDELDDLGLELDEPVHTAVAEPVSRLRAAEPKFESRRIEQPEHSEPRELPPIEEYLVIIVVSRDGAGFKGPALLQSILESGLRFGEKDIFHRHESLAGNGEVLFSMANALKPGTFDLDDIDHFSTRAVSFFLVLPGPRHPKQAFELMVAAARKLAQELNGELKDDQRSVMTAQTIEHYRQRIADFERRQLTHKR
ncbi:cell division protein ZipA [Azotobacter vinelandii CA]|uniref:Cell division protein ZipA n=2 Tax=Azotobacter vinelandii TaxID=354 RepID=ZIPA_AZOVD|nr:cell division protein ZipA [Azotobacter vinelandii]C1DN28.1 RecName: Full=Cell division protein ZipA [Azotobacter vinelandii DJ]ACO79195.1 cell division protein ZipA [Azotobacter vinelandii DJ]AGK12947.1 cell division protein ZipA [Azotobacter vinelandii CA]AGK18997.1 cell division protein ZipA [Azotobacter vinelandii CA6]WKN20165.1 cell division protein ZipA [Azotobacter vinelandii]SFX95564.1 cell division protein ZipA [Azotobacter vinelandii]